LSLNSAKNKASVSWLLGICSCRQLGKNSCR
jgi:hypothetical protein